MLTLPGSGEKNKITILDLENALKSSAEPDKEFIVVEVGNETKYATRVGWDDDGNLYLVCEQDLPPL